MNTISWLLFLSLVFTFFHSNSSVGTNADLEEIYIFVRSVLAMADREELGLPDKPIVQPQYGPVVNGKLPADLQMYLERLVSTSPAVDKQSLVAMLWDDTVVINDDQDPHEVFSQYHDRGNIRKQSTVESTPVFHTTSRSQQDQKTSFNGNQANTRRVKTLYDGLFQYKRAKS